MTLPPLWDPERDERLVCVDVRQETHDVRTFVFAPVEPRLFRFLPGQFMTFELAGPGVQRCYTIASPPTRPWRIEITVKRNDAGDGSRWLHETMRPGISIRVSGPMGEFTTGAEPSGRFLFLAAGSGITPLMSMARAMHDLGSGADVVFIQSARTASDLIFAAELQAMQGRSAFRAICVVSQDRPGLRWNGLRGRLSESMLLLAVPDLTQREVFCCGPASYMAAIRQMLESLGHDRSRYHEESFDFTTGDDGTSDRVAEPALAGFRVTFTRSGQSIVCPAESTVLAAARARSIRLPSACTKGVCGTCKSRLVSGTVDMQHGGGIRQREIDAGFALLCCAKPTSDLVIER